MKEIKELLEVIQQEHRTGIKCPINNPENRKEMQAWINWARKQPSLSPKRKPIGHVRSDPDWDNVAGYHI